MDFKQRSFDISVSGLIPKPTKVGSLQGNQKSVVKVPTPPGGYAEMAS